MTLHLRAACALILSLSTLACASAPIRVAPEAQALASMDRSSGREISSERCGFQLLLLIPIGINQRFQKVWADLERQAGGDTIADVEAQESWRWAFVGTLYCTRLVAMAYRPG